MPSCCWAMPRARRGRTGARFISGEQGETTMAAHFSRSPDSFSNQPGPRVPRASKRGHFQLRSGYWQAQSGQLADAPTMLGRRLWRAPFARCARPNEIEEHRAFWPRATRCPVRLWRIFAELQPSDPLTKAGHDAATALPGSSTVSQAGHQKALRHPAHDPPRHQAAVPMDRKASP